MFMQFYAFIKDSDDIACSSFSRKLSEVQDIACVPAGQSRIHKFENELMSVNKTCKKHDYTIAYEAFGGIVDMVVATGVS